MSWSTSELRVRLAPFNWFKPSSKIFYWPFQVLLWIFHVFVLSCVCYVFVSVCLYVLWGNLLGKGWSLGSRLWCLLWVCHFPIGILGQVWYLIVSIPDLCTLTYFGMLISSLVKEPQHKCRWKMAKNITVKHYKDVVLEKSKNIIRNDALSLVLKYPSSKLQCPCSCLRNSYGVLEERESNCFVSPLVFPRSCPMWFLYVFEIEIIPWWAEVLVLTGSWICYSSVPYYCAQISLPWRLQEVDTSVEALHF